MPDPKPLLVYDGCCALCNGWVRFILAVDRQGPLTFASIGSPAADALRLHPKFTGVDSILFVHGDRCDTRSTAVLEIFRYLGSPWRLLLIGYLVPREIRDSLYDVVAYWRYRIFGRYPTCPLPPADARDRFLG